jgi:hypothetical protein
MYQDPARMLRRVTQPLHFTGPLSDRSCLGTSTYGDNYDIHMQSIKVERMEKVWHVFRFGGWHDQYMQF